MSIVSKIDLHMHTMASDGTDTPAGLLSRVKDAGITLFSVTDHDTIGSCGAIEDMLTEKDPEFINGVEFSCIDDEGKYHILGYGFDPDAPALKELLLSCHAFRLERVRKRLDFIAKEFGFVFSEEDEKKLFSLYNPGKPHIGNLMVKYGYTATKEDAIYNYLNKYQEKEKRICPEYAIRSISDAGGIPVLAHPSYGSGEELVTGKDMDERLKRLIACGLKGVEAFYSGFSNVLIDEMLAFADKYGLYVTAGSDYHGSNKTVKLGDTHFDGAEYPEGLKAFLRDVTKRKINGSER